MCSVSNFELDGIYPRYMTSWFNLTLSKSRMKVKFIGPSSRSRSKIGTQQPRKWSTVAKSSTQMWKIKLSWKSEILVIKNLSVLTIRNMHFFRYYASATEVEGIKRSCCQSVCSSHSLFVSCRSRKSDAFYSYG